MHYIFLVHGMGNWASGWSEDAQEIIKRHYNKEQYAFLDAHWPFEKHFRFEPIDFNDVFETYLQEAEKQGRKLEQWHKLKAGLGGTGLVRSLARIVDIAKTPPNKDNFAVTHLADVALYMATNLCEEVKNGVALEIVKRLNAGGFNRAQGDTWSVIAHSLGTRVMTDVLQVAFSSQSSLRNFGKAQVLMMVANVSKLLERIAPWKTGDAYRNAVYPSADALGVCWHYINVGHSFDPFAFIDEFDPPADFGETNAFLEKVYHPIKLGMSDITSKEIHSLEHYLEHPDVHATLLRFLVSRRGKKGPTKEEYEEAMKVYRLNTLGAQVDDAWRSSLRKLKDKARRGDWQEIFDLWERYGDLQ